MKFKVVLTGLTALIAVAAIAQAEDRQLRKDMERLYAKFDHFAETNNVNGMMSYFGPNYVYVDTQGQRMDAMQLKSMYAEMGKMCKDVHSDTAVKHVQGNRANSNEAYAWVQMKMTYKVQQGKGWVKMISTKRFAETLVKSSDGWRVTMTQELPLDEPWPFSTGN